MVRYVGLGIDYPIEWSNMFDEFISFIDVNYFFTQDAGYRVGLKR